MKVFMEPKPFAVGLRIQHPQAQINKNQYGMEDAGKLGAAPYTGFVEFCRSEKPGGSAGRTGSRRRGGKR